MDNSTLFLFHPEDKELCLSTFANVCEICGFHSSIKDSGLLGCDPTVG
jgi:hypothetical protein